VCGRQSYARVERGRTGLAATGPARRARTRPRYALDKVVEPSYSYGNVFVNVFASNRSSFEFQPLPGGFQLPNRHDLGHSA
jgi:hypothetical protein